MNMSVFDIIEFINEVWKIGNRFESAYGFRNEIYWST